MLRASFMSWAEKRPERCAKSLVSTTRHSEIMRPGGRTSRPMRPNDSKSQAISVWGAANCCTRTTPSCAFGPENSEPTKQSKTVTFSCLESLRAARMRRTSAPLSILRLRTKWYEPARPPHCPLMAARESPMRRDIRRREIAIEPHAFRSRCSSPNPSRNPCRKPSTKPSTKAISMATARAMSKAMRTASRKAFGKPIAKANVEPLRSPATHIGRWLTQANRRAT